MVLCNVPPPEKAKGGWHDGWRNLGKWKVWLDRTLVHTYVVKNKKLRNLNVMVVAPGLGLGLGTGIGTGTGTETGI